MAATAMDVDTIYALSTGPGRAAIAIVRVSGPLALQVADRLAGRGLPARRAMLRTLRHPVGGRVLDRALVLCFPAPNSETGEDLVEFQVHGGRAVVSSMLRALSTVEGLRPAEPGEFARRALLNGKMSLLDVEALADLIDSDTELQRRQAVEGAGSLLQGRAEAWRTLLLDALAEMTAAIDFSDEGDVAAHFDSRAQQWVTQCLEDMERALGSAHRGERLRDGLNIVLLGPPNAGKSSLLNALAGRDAAIVSHIPGTTRDRVEVRMDLGGVPIILIDTAGLRDSNDEVEQQGMRLSSEAAARADLVLWLSPVDDPAAPPALAATVWIVTTKSDLGAPVDSGSLRISTLTGDGIADLLGALETFGLRMFSLGEPALVTRARQRLAIVEAIGELRAALALGEDHIELRAEYLHRACSALERLVGRIGVEDVLGAVFSRFCVGK